VSELASELASEPMGAELCQPNGVRL